MSDQERVHLAAGRLSQLLGESQIHAAPEVARIHHAERYRQLELFLEDLETHTSHGITPFLQKVLDNAEIPAEFEGILREAIETPAQFSAIVTQLFLYGIVSQLLSASITPFIQSLSNQLWPVAVRDGVYVPLSPATIATAAARGLQLGAPPTVKMPQWAYDRAAESGVGPEDIDLMASIVGTPPAPQELFELLRRGIIDLPRLKQGMAEGDTRDDWIDQLAQLSHGWLTPVDFIRAAVQGQMSYADAAAWASKTGLDTTTALPITASQVGGSDDMFGLGWAIAGRPPGPQELAAMTLRGIIPQNGRGAGAVTFEQGIAESDVKTKWTDALFQLAQYVPAPNEIGTLLERGAITHDQAVTLWERRGVPTELANGYAYIAQQEHIGQDKLLAKSTILTAYYDQLITREEAIDYLDQLGYVGNVADEMLAVQDFRREMTAINAVVRRINTLYGQGKLSATDAQNALVKVGLDPAQAARILSHWAVLKAEPVHLPTVTEIGAAVKYQTLTVDEALTELGLLGYEPRDAAIVLSAHAQMQVAPLPPAGRSVTG